MNLIEIVKKKLEAKGWDFSSDYWNDEELAAFYEVITETEAALSEADVMESGFDEDDEQLDEPEPCPTCGDIDGMVNPCCAGYDPLHYKNCGYG